MAETGTKGRKMTSETGPRSAADDLALIREMMEAGKKRVAVNGIHFIIWGLVLMLAFFAQYASVYGYIPRTMLGIWIPAFVIGGVAEYILLTRFETCDEDSVPLLAHGAAWESVGIAALVYFGVAIAAGTFEPRVISSINAGMIGAAFFITARVTGVNWLRIPAVGWWIVLAYVAYVPVYDPELLLVMAAAAGTLLALPGFLMRRLAPAGAQAHD
jgi:hypothetical protein